MDDGEGSVFVDGVDGDSPETSATENVNNQQEEGSETKKESSEEGSQDTTSENKDATVEGQEQPENKKQDDEPKKEVTEKGTKLDTDPLSKANQLRANAEAEARQYQALLNDPVRLKAYVAELEAERGESAKATPKTDLSSIDPDKLETVDDLRSFAKAMIQEVNNVKQQFHGLSTSQSADALSRRIQGGIAEVTTKYSELREFNTDGSKNPEYNEELDKLVGETFNDFDLDKRTGKYRGQFNIVDIADRIMKARGLGESTGSRKAQTEVKDKRAGRITGIGAETVTPTADESKLSPSATIAARMQKAASRKK